MDKIYNYIFLALCVLLCGCQSKSKIEPGTPFTLTDSFSSSGEVCLAEPWWQSFEDPNLSAVIEQGLADNFNIRIVWDRLRQAEQTAVILGANRYPQIDFVGRGARTYERIEGSDASFSAYELGAGAAYEVDRWGRVRSIHQAAALDAETAYEDVATAAITLSAAIAQIWMRM